MKYTPKIGDKVKIIGNKSRYYRSRFHYFEVGSIGTIVNCAGDSVEVRQGKVIQWAYPEHISPISKKKPAKKAKECKHKWHLYPFVGERIGQPKISIKAICLKCLKTEYR